MKRDKDFIQSQLYEKDGKLYCKQKTIIEFPKWYQDKGLANIQESTYVYGIFAICMGDKYSVSLIPTLCAMTPIMITEIERDGVVYTQFNFGKDDVVLDNVKVVKHDILSFTFFETFYMQARTPWYIGYEDMTRIMDNLPKYANSNLGANMISNELVTSFIARDESNKKTFFRQKQNKLVFIDLMSPYYSSLSGINTLAGNYFTQSLTSAIVQPKSQATKLESLVR